MAKRNNKLEQIQPNKYFIGGSLLAAGVSALAPTVISKGKQLLFGNINKELVSSIENQNQQIAGLQVSTGSLDNIQNQWGSTNFGSSFSQSDIGSNGLFSNKATREYNRLLQEQNAARQSAIQALSQAALSTENQLDSNIIANTAAYGGSINIKPSKRGTFTAEATKRGKSVQAFASQVLANKENYTPAMVKKANFARNASKWKHKDGGRIDFSTYKPVFNRSFIPENMEQLQDSLINREFGPSQRAALLSSVLHESGGKTNAKSGQFRGIAQWSKERHPNTEDLGEQIHYLIESSLDPNSPNWSDGGDGAPYIQRAIDGYNAFWNPNIGPYNATMYYNKGYIRPKEKQARVNRAVEAGNMYNMMKGKKKALGGDLNNDFSNGVTIVGNGGSHEENPFEGVQFGIDQNGTPNLVEEGEVIFNDYVYSDRIKVPKSVKSKYKLGNNKDITFAQAAKKISRESEERPNDPLSKAGLEIGLSRLAQEQEALKLQKQDMQKGNKFLKGGNLRYAPVIGNAIGLLANVFNKPDYSRANAIERAAREASMYTPVSFTPIGTKLSFTPSDRNWQVNKLQSQNAATRSALRNSISPATNAALLAADYNAGIGLGDLMERAQRYDQEQLQKVAAFNRETDIANSEMGLKAAMANQQAQQSANQIRLNGITAAIGMRDEIDARRNAALSANLSGLMTSLGNVGIDSYNQRQAGLTQLNSGIPLTVKPDGVTQEEWEEYLRLRDSHPEWYSNNNINS